ncbi:unnamed protein product [Caenorhabditis angaria]|uniref:Uncharacterized protein n=1 Tax=Caenorhabditis angaria TaxID=860376 RepID=A0A9P1IGU2_9PELO|nr:unnamed protein product [Caenorhabditis angaria]
MSVQRLQFETKYDLEYIMENNAQNDQVMEYKRLIQICVESSFQDKVKALIALLPLLNLSIISFRDLSTVKISTKIFKRLDSKTQLVFSKHFLQACSHPVLGEFLFANSTIFNISNETVGNLQDTFNSNPINVMELLESIKNGTLSIDRIDIELDQIPCCDEISILMQKHISKRDAAIFIFKKKNKYDGKYEDLFSSKKKLADAMVALKLLWTPKCPKCHKPMVLYFNSADTKSQFRCPLDKKTAGVRNKSFFNNRKTLEFSIRLIWLLARKVAAKKIVRLADTCENTVKSFAFKFAYELPQHWSASERFDFIIDRTIKKSNFD